MTNVTLREQLHQQIDRLPDDIVQQIADFALFLAIKQKSTLDYVDWDDDQWRDFALAQFFQEADEIEYSLEDAQEIYHS